MTDIRRVLVADDDEAIRRLIEYTLQQRGFEPVLVADGSQAIARASDDLLCAVIDLKMPNADGMAVLEHFRVQHPDVPVLIVSAVGQTRDAVAAVKMGAFDYVSKPFEVEELGALVESAARMGRALQQHRALREAVGRSGPPTGLVAAAAVTRDLLAAARRVAPLDLTVLITGESGVGKGVLARLIHQASPRAAGPVITVSCPALPRDLIESELFGSEKGAFTGAERRMGRFEMAAGGTLFLDEIGELPLTLQPKLLNVLQDRTFHRLGASKELAADFRLIAATNASLVDQVARKEFREDLYHRLNVVPLTVPPLRERREDLPVLCREILDRIASTRGCRPFTLSAGAIEAIGRYDWPGNVRELENVLERTTAFIDGDLIDATQLPPEVTRAAGERAAPPSAGSGPHIAGLPLEVVERLAIQQTLAACGGNKALAARTLGITEKSIYNKMTRLGLR